MTCPRRLAFFSKIEALGNPLVRAFAEGYLVIAVDRDAARVDTVKKALRFMEAGIPVMVTPEGTRSRDGQLQAFKPGFVKLAHTARVPILPVGITGTYEVCPKGHRFPRPGKIGVHFGRPYYELLDAGAKWDDPTIAEHVARVRTEVVDLLNPSQPSDLR
jgi:1-acyl-sn-glycerol-3-phosphate acyltransferase